MTAIRYANLIELAQPQSIAFGSGAVGAVPRLAATRGLARTLVIADAFNASRVDLLGLAGEVAVFGEVKPEPDIPNLDRRRSSRRSGGSSRPRRSRPRSASCFLRKPARSRGSSL